MSIPIDWEKGREDCIFILGHKVERRHAVTCVGTSRMIRSGISTTNLLNPAKLLWPMTGFGSDLPLSR